MDYRLIYYQKEIFSQGKQETIKLIIKEAVESMFTIEQLSDSLQSIRFIKNDFIVNVKTTHGTESKYLAMIPNNQDKKEVALIILSY